MSLTTTQYKRTLRKDSRFSFELVQAKPLGISAWQWMKENGKGYTETTISRFKIQEGTLRHYDNSLGGGSRSYVCSDPCLVIPVGPIRRCYRYLLPKSERWYVTPAGYGAQWLGDLSQPELLICEGEWDALRAFDMGFGNAVSHTAGSMTWLSKWTPLFKGKKIWVCYDRDPIGIKGAGKVAGKLSSVAEAVRIIDLPLPGTPDSKDISDYFRHGGNKDGFRKLIEGARPYISRIRRAR